MPFKIALDGIPPMSIVLDFSFMCGHLIRGSTSWWNLELSVFTRKSKFHSCSSAVVTLGSDDLLRLVPLFMWMRNSLSDGDVLMKRILSEILKKGSETQLVPLMCLLFSSNRI